MSKLQLKIISWNKSSLKLNTSNWTRGEKVTTKISLVANYLKKKIFFGNVRKVQVLGTKRKKIRLALDSVQCFKLEDNTETYLRYSRKENIRQNYWSQTDLHFKSQANCCDCARTQGIVLLYLFLYHIIFVLQVHSNIYKSSYNIS
jgi:hypothetical protein